jgi:hypothetical protein
MRPQTRNEIKVPAVNNNRFAGAESKLDGQGNYLGQGVDASNKLQIGPHARVV